MEEVVMTDRESNKLAMEIVRKLDGMKIAEARWVLHMAEQWLCSTHRVDCGNPDFTAADAEVRRVAGQ